MFHGLQFIVDVELRCHQDEAVHIDSSDSRVDDKRVPAFVLVIHRRVDRVDGDQRVKDVG